MSVSTADAGSTNARGAFGGLWDRQLDTYPETGRRMLYLGVTVLATVMLYYELYVLGSVSTLILAKLHMSFSFLVVTLAIGNLVGAFGSLFAGLTDRVGRSRLVIIGLFITALLTLFAIPAATSRWTFAILYCVIGVVEGICLVATPALIRDFSPQTGRATAMGFWTSGPVLGSLIVSVVGSNTIHATTSWTYEFRICGVAGLVVAVIALFALRELSPGLRDQLMVSMRDRALVEARAKGLDIEASLRNPWGQLLKPDVIISALGVAVMLLVYYTAVAFGTIYFVTIFGKSLKDANGLGNWNWGFNVIAVILVGFLSDKFRVRKPFMVIGGVLAAVMLVIYLLQAGHHPGYYTLAIMVALLSFGLGVAYTPWMASFTETVEARNPALTATGLAIWGWIVRIVVFVSYIILPHVITTVTPLIDYGTGVQTAAAQYAPQVAAVSAHPALFAELNAHPTAALEQQAVAAVGASEFGKIVAASKAPGNAALYGTADGKAVNGFNYVLTHGTAVEKAAKDSPGQWKDWYWICFGGIVVFLGCIPVLKGRWTPKAAKADEDAHEALVQAELATLHTNA